MSGRHRQIENTVHHVFRLSRSGVALRSDDGSESKAAAPANDQRGATSGEPSTTAAKAPTAAASIPPATSRTRSSSLTDPSLLPLLCGPYASPWGRAAVLATEWPQHASPVGPAWASSVSLSALAAVSASTGAPTAASLAAAAGIDGAAALAVGGYGAAAVPVPGRGFDVAMSSGLLPSASASAGAARSLPSLDALFDGASSGLSALAAASSESADERRGASAAASDGRYTHSVHGEIQLARRAGLPMAAPPSVPAEAPAGGPLLSLAAAAGDRASDGSSGSSASAVSSSTSLASAFSASAPFSRHLQHPPPPRAVWAADVHASIASIQAAQARALMVENVVLRQLLNESNAELQATRGRAAADFAAASTFPSPQVAVTVSSLHGPGARGSDHHDAESAAIATAGQAAQPAAPSIPSASSEYLAVLQVAASASPRPAEVQVASSGSGPLADSGTVELRPPHGDPAVGPLAQARIESPSTSGTVAAAARHGAGTGAAAASGAAVGATGSAAGSVASSVASSVSGGAAAERPAKRRATSAASDDTGSDSSDSDSGRYRDSRQLLTRGSVAASDAGHCVSSGASRRTSGAAAVDTQARALPASAALHERGRDAAVCVSAASDSGSAGLVTSAERLPEPPPIVAHDSEPNSEELSLAQSAATAASIAPSRPL